MRIPTGLLNGGKWNGTKIMFSFTLVLIVCRFNLSFIHSCTSLDSSIILKQNWFIDPTTLLLLFHLYFLLWYVKTEKKKHTCVDIRAICNAWWFNILNCIWKWLEFGWKWLEFGWKCHLYTTFSTIQKFGFWVLTIRSSEASENRFLTRFLKPYPTPSSNHL